jgi:hypothetical protein
MLAHNTTGAQVASIFDRVVAALFGDSTSPPSEADKQLIEELTEALVDTVEPRVRTRSGYREKLTGGVQRMLEHLRAIGQERREPLLLSRGAWSQDPRINAFFATADDVRACVGRSHEVRRFFEQNPDCGEVYAFLGMKREERTVFAPKLEGDTLKHDVAQATVSFTGHRLLAPAAELAQTRLEVGRRIMQRVAQLALSHILALDQKATDLQQRKGYLATRLKVLMLARDGMENLVNDPATIEQQIREIERELKSTVADYIETKATLATLDGYIEQINQVLALPEEQVKLAHVPLRINRMGIKIEAGSSEPAENLDLAELSIGEGLRATVAFVRIPRAELPPKEDLIAQAERYLQ